MTRTAKKIIVYSLVGILQFGLGAATLEASPRHDGHGPGQRYEQHRNDHRNDRERERERRLKLEKARHEREMMRRQHESEWAWRDRQRAENERHDRIVKDIVGLVILGAILNN